MSVKSALLFIEHLRTSPLRAELREQAPALDAFPALGRAAGYEFTVEELRTAFRHDWGLQWLKANQAPKP